MAEIAHVGREAKLYRRLIVALAGERRAAIGRQALHGALDGERVDGRKRRQNRTHKFMHRFGGEHAGGGKDARNRTYQHTPYAQEPRHVDGMQRAAAAERHQRKIARILAALDRHGANGARHIDVRHLTDAVRRVFDAQPQRPGDMLLHRARRQRRIDRKRSAGERMAVEKAEHHIGVRHRRPIGAAAIAGGPRIATGALRPHDQEPAGIDAGHRAAAGADFGNVDRRRLQHVAARP